MKAFSKENNLKGLEMQGLLKLDMHPLWKHFPQWRATVTTHPSSREDDSDPDSHEDPDAESEENDGGPVSRTEEQAREDIARGDLCFDQTSPDAVDGSPENIRRVVPLVRMLQRIRDHDESVSEEEHQVVMQCAMNTVQSSVLKDYVCRRRASRGAPRRADIGGST